MLLEIGAVTLEGFDRELLLWPSNVWTVERQEP
jgi:hypothetical protein